MDVVLDRFGDGARREGRLAHAQVVEQRPERVNITAGIHGLPQGLFGGHVGRGAHRCAGLGFNAAFQQLSQAQVGYYRVIGQPTARLRLEHNVARFDIPVQHAPAMGVIQGPADLRDQLDGFREHDPISLGAQLVEHLLQVAAGDESHHDVEHTRFARVEHLDDPGVLEAGSHNPLLQEALLEVWPVLQVGVHDLDGHLALQVGVVGAVNLSHSAAAQESLQLVSSKCFAGKLLHAAHSSIAKTKTV